MTVMGQTGCGKLARNNPKWAMPGTAHEWPQTSWAMPGNFLKKIKKSQRAYYANEPVPGTAHHLQA